MIDANRYFNEFGTISTGQTFTICYSAKMKTSFFFLYYYSNIAEIECVSRPNQPQNKHSGVLDFGFGRWKCFFFLEYFHLPCDETALERAKSILFATIITGRVRIKSKSWNVINSCSMRVNDALSTHEYTNINASALMYSSCE